VSYSVKVPLPHNSAVSAGAGGPAFVQLLSAWTCRATIRWPAYRTGAELRVPADIARDRASLFLVTRKLRDTLGYAAGIATYRVWPSRFAGLGCAGVMPSGILRLGWI
jgi:hypothetical protein